MIAQERLCEEMELDARDVPQLASGVWLEFVLGKGSMLRFSGTHLGLFRQQALCFVGRRLGDALSENWEVEGCLHLCPLF